MYIFGRSPIECEISVCRKSDSAVPHLKGINSRSCYQLRVNGNPKQDVLSQWFSEICHSTSIFNYN